MGYIARHGRIQRVREHEVVHLGLEVVTSANSGVTTTTRLDFLLPAELPSVEER